MSSIFWVYYGLQVCGHTITHQYVCDTDIQLGIVTSLPAADATNKTIYSNNILQNNNGRIIKKTHQLFSR